MKLSIILFFLITCVYANLNYYYLYNIYKQKYNNHIQIIEDNIRDDGLFIFNIDKNNVCIKSTHIYIKKKNIYELKFTSLIHELTHYLQCIYSFKFNKPFSSVTNYKPKKQTISFINSAYNESYYNEEYEAYYYSQNYKNFNKLENIVLY